MVVVSIHVSILKSIYKKLVLIILGIKSDMLYFYFFCLELDKKIKFVSRLNMSLKFDESNHRRLSGTIRF